jgi:hypothetical protein
MIDQVAQAFNGTKTAHDTVTFSHSDSEFVLTDGTVYQSLDGQLGAGGKKARTLAAVQKFVSLRT